MLKVLPSLVIRVIVPSLLGIICWAVAGCNARAAVKGNVAIKVAAVLRRFDLPKSLSPLNPSLTRGVWGSLSGFFFKIKRSLSTFKI